MWVAMSDADVESIELVDRDAATPWLARLVDQHDRELLAICIVAGATPVVARDAVQNAWLRAATRLSTLREPAHVRGWLITVTMNELRQIWRRQNRTAVRTAPLEYAEDLVSIDQTGDPDLAAALARLPSRDRQIIGLTVLAGLNSAEAGKVLGLSGPGVRTRKARILDTLRKELEG